MAMLRGPGRHEQGFALVALILVLAIIGILAAVSASSLVGPTLVGPIATASSTETVDPETNIVATANTTGCADELRIVQTAMDTMMAANNLTAVTVQTVATNTFSALPAGTGTRPLSPDYLRQDSTRGSYTWSASGLVSAAATGACS